uniref:DUF4897 domain-containing protein n=1 Tax=Strongyloides venezuelensis TaxID=75913 RepID=A0A0K0F1A5_STRVS
MNTYTIDLTKMRDDNVRWHAVPNERKNSIFEDLYGKRYLTNLVIIDKTTNTSIKVNDTKSFLQIQHINMFLSQKNPNITSLEVRDIKETEFRIHLIKSNNLDDFDGSNKSTDSTKSLSTIWIIVGVSVGTVLIILPFSY